MHNTAPSLIAPRASSLRDYWSLTKPGVMTLVVFTGLAGMVAAFSPDHTLHPLLAVIALLGIAMGSGAGAAFNMWYDRDIDAVMTRTRTRPIPAGRVNEAEALAFAIGLSVLSIALLGLAANWLAAFWLGFATLFYAGVYTVLLKRRTPQNIVIGGAAGAFPAVIGWAAVTGTTPLEPWLYFLIVFLWTPPHFWALALTKSGEYAKVGVPMLPVVAGPASTRRHIIFYTVLLVAASLLPALLGMRGAVYAAAALVLGGWMAMKAFRLWRSPSDGKARALFGCSIAYLFLLFTAIILDKATDIPLGFSFSM